MFFLLFNSEFISKNMGEIQNQESSLAKLSLPHWINLRVTSVGIQIITTQKLLKASQIGPLVAPPMSSLQSNTKFPLKVKFKSEACLYLDCEQENLCNWLALIPSGGPNNNNLLATQIDEFIYYIVREDIYPGTSLQVWYCPMYKSIIQYDMNNLENNIVQDRFSECVENNNNDLQMYGHDINSPSSITDGKGQITFTHAAPHLKPPEDSNHVNKRIDNGTTIQNKNTLENICNSIIDINEIHDKENHVPLNVESKIINKTGFQEFPVTITLGEECHIQSIEYEDFDKIDTPCGLVVTQNSDNDYLLTVSREYESTRKHKTRITVETASAEILGSLLPLALGAKEPRPWSCNHCSKAFDQVIPFAKHLKSHLLRLVGRCHVCRECGDSFTSFQILQRHLQLNHPYISHTIQDDLEVTVKRELLSDEEEIKENVTAISQVNSQDTNAHCTCQICGKNFNRWEYLLRHLRKHTGDFTCQHCQKVFARKESLLKHLCPKRDSAIEEESQCTMCDRTFTNTALLQQHYLKHKSSKKCSRCGRHFCNRERHNRICGSEGFNLGYQCDICGKEFGSEKMMTRHHNSHAQVHHCKNCGKNYASKHNLSQHQALCRQIEKINSNGEVDCEQCGQKCTDTETFRAHYLTHTHPFHCVSCNQKFQTRNGYEIHVCDIEYQCDECPDTFRSVTNLNRHASVHGQPPYACATCRRPYFRKESLSRHLCQLGAVAIENKKSYPCHLCSSILSTKHSLNTHIKAAHGGVSAKELACEVCGKLFHRRDLLREHQSVHRAPSLPCHICQKLFKTNKSMQVHMALHTGNKKFVCKYCNKRFHQKVNLLRHERHHKPQGAICCQHCGTQCLSQLELEEHLLSHTVQNQEESNFQMESNDAMDTGNCDSQQMPSKTGQESKPKSEHLNLPSNTQTSKANILVTEKKYYNANKLTSKFNVAEPTMKQSVIGSSIIIPQDISIASIEGAEKQLQIDSKDISICEKMPKLSSAGRLMTSPEYLEERDAAALVSQPQLHIRVVEPSDKSVETSVLETMGNPMTSTSCIIIP
ncbi:unnamed protein product, partial [Meganyctiphanes norvegica]